MFLWAWSHVFGHGLNFCCWIVVFYLLIWWYFFHFFQCLVHFIAIFTIFIFKWLQKQIACYVNFNTAIFRQSVKSYTITKVNSRWQWLRNITHKFWTWSTFWLKGVAGCPEPFWLKACWKHVLYKMFLKVLRKHFCFLGKPNFVFPMMFLSGINNTLVQKRSNIVMNNYIYSRLHSWFQFSWQKSNMNGFI
jgi:hypothetical protein